jgi:hypothetical protein
MRRLRSKRSEVFIGYGVEDLLLDPNGFGMGNGRNPIGGLAGNRDREIGHFRLRCLRLLLEVLNHPVLLLNGVTASEEVTVFVIAGAFRSGRIGGRGAMRQDQR